MCIFFFFYYNVIRIIFHAKYKWFFQRYNKKHENPSSDRISHQDIFSSASTVVVGGPLQVEGKPLSPQYYRCRRRIAYTARLAGGQRARKRRRLHGQEALVVRRLRRRPRTRRRRWCDTVSHTHVRRRARWPVGVYSTRNRASRRLRARQSSRGR